MLTYFFFFFFFQAEDGIRDVAVTGVQTCALPISCGAQVSTRGARSGPVDRAHERLRNVPRGTSPPLSQVGRPVPECSTWNIPASPLSDVPPQERSGWAGLEDRENRARIRRKRPRPREPEPLDRCVPSESLHLLRRHEKQPLPAGHQDRDLLSFQEVVRTYGAQGQVATGKEIHQIVEPAHA